MQTVQDGEKPGFDPRGVESGIGRPSKKQVLLGSGSLALAVIEAMCLFFVSANGLIVLLGGASIAFAQSAAIFHAAAIRLPLLSLATIGALLNLWLLFNAWRLRSASSARWRKKPLDKKERWRIVIVATLSILTLVFVGAELFLHHRLHGSPFARTFNPVVRIERNSASV